jgi:hypothetical protein
VGNEWREAGKGIPSSPSLGGGCGRERREERGAAENALGLVRMQPHLLPLVGRERLSLLPDANRHRDPAHVMDERTAPDVHEIGVLETALASRRGRQRRHSRRMADEVVRGKIGEVAHRRESAVDRLTPKRHRRARLAGENVLPYRGAGFEGEDLRRVGREPPGYHWIEGAARSLTDDPRGEFVAAEHSLERAIAGHVSDSHRERDLTALRTTGHALAVPALGEVDEQRLDRGGETEPVAQHLPDLAEGGDKPLELPGCPRQLARNLNRAYGGRATRRGERSHDPDHRLRSRTESARTRVSRQRVLAAEELGGGLRPGRAAHVEEQAQVVRLRRRFRVDVQTVAEPHRKQRAVQTVLEGHPDAEVGRERQRRDHLRGPNLVTARRCFVRHVETVPRLGLADDRRRCGRACLGQREV